MNWSQGCSSGVLAATGVTQVSEGGGVTRVRSAPCRVDTQDREFQQTNALRCRQTPGWTVPPCLAHTVLNSAAAPNSTDSCPQGQMGSFIILSDFLYCTGQGISSQSCFSMNLITLVYLKLSSFEMKTPKDRESSLPLTVWPVANRFCLDKR